MTKQNKTATDRQAIDRITDLENSVEEAFDRNEDQASIQPQRSKLRKLFDRLYEGNQTFDKSQTAKLLTQILKLIETIFKNNPP